MILFDKLIVRNFGSFGNAPTVVDLNVGMALVQGRNGTGKSTIVTDSLTYVLYGKPFKKINLPQLVNNMNGANMEVQLEFRASDSKTEYKIIRGMKPNRFEIYKNGELIPQEASVRDYQAILERDIIKVSYRAFMQILVMGSAQYTPFMQLSTGQRRVFIDELLNTKIIATMSDLSKSKLSEAERTISLLETKITALKNETANKQQILNDMINSSSARISVIESERDSLEKRKEELHQLMITKKLDYDRLLVEHNKRFDHIEDYTSELRVLRDKLKANHREEERVKTTDSCTHCKQCISDDHKATITAEILKLRSELEASILDVTNKEAISIEMRSLAEESEKTLREMKDDIVELKNTAIRVSDRVGSLVAEINRAREHSSDDIEKFRDNIRKTAENALETIRERDQQAIHRDNLLTTKAILSDSGVKSKIIGTYIPMINREVNEILSEMDMFVSFQLDENFNETILHRGREDMSYSSLSEGEKRRVDLALLSAFRRIVMMKESGGVNLLVLDEMDSGLDFDGRAKFLELVRKMSPNSWVISHAIRGSGLETEFDKVIAVDKVGDFTVIRED